MLKSQLNCKKLIGYFIFLAIFIEILLRLFVPELSYFYKASIYFRYAMEDNGLYWINKPHYHNKNFIKINSWGYRSPEIEDEKIKERLLLLGDSVVFGWGVHQDSIFSTLLAEKLIDYEIINCGVPGWNTQEEANFLIAEGLHWKPDIVLLIITNNDFAERSKRPTRLQKNLLRSYLLTTLFYIKKQVFNDHFYSKLQSDKALNAFENIIELCKTNNIQLICCLYTKDNITKFYFNLCGKNKIPTFFLPEQIHQHQNSFIDGHLNTKGHKIIAEIVWKIVLIINEIKY